MNIELPRRSPVSLHGLSHALVPIKWQTADEDLSECLEDCIDRVALIAGECAGTGRRWRDEEFDVTDNQTTEILSGGVGPGTRLPHDDSNEHGTKGIGSEGLARPPAFVWRDISEILSGGSLQLPNQEQVFVPSNALPLSLDGLSLHRRVIRYFLARPSSHRNA